MTLLLRTAARSDVGLVRAGNEDSGYAGPDLLVVADGMGGHAAGELASATAVATLAQLETAGLDDRDAVTQLADAVELASERIADLIAEQPELAGMGTTVTALAWLGSRPDAPARVALVHVGDSRAYLLRDGELSQLSRDHTYVQTLVDAGRITPAEAAVHPRRSLLMRTIDGVHPAEPDLSVREARLGDRYLVCSDGLSGVVSETELHGLLNLADPTAAVSALVDAALAAGAPDNVTCVVADVVDTADLVAPVTSPEDGSFEPEAAEQTDVADVPVERRPGRPVVVGAAGERAVREQLPDLEFPVDAEPDPDAPAVHGGTQIVRVNTAPDARQEGPLALARVYAEEHAARPRRTRHWVLAAVIALLVVIVGAVVAFGLWARGQWFVGESDGYVAVYQGVPGSIGPLALHRVAQQSDLAVDQLPTFEAEQVRATIYVASEGAADATLTRLQTRADQCRTDPSAAGCPGAPA